MLTCANVVAYLSIVEGFSHVWQTVRVNKSFRAEGLIIFVGSHTGEVFVIGIRPKVVLGTCNVYLVWSICRDQPMLIKGQCVLVIHIAVIFLTKPIGKLTHYICDSLA